MNTTNSGIDQAAIEAIDLLKKLISTQSFSGDESQVARFVTDVLLRKGYKPNLKGNNVWVVCNDFDATKPTLMLNSHLDTVKPALGWTTDPFKPVLDGDKLFGLGSNDAGASLVSLLFTFIMTDAIGLPFNRVFVASAEEENSGVHGMEYVLPELTMVDAAIIGEPTGMQMAIAEKGLMVLDCEVYGKTGHAARTGGINAIELAMKEIAWFHTFKFPESSPLLGNVKMTVTQIQGGTQHNVIPALCSFVVDVRTNEKYRNKKALDVIQANVNAKVTPRSLRMNASAIASDHPLVKAAETIGVERFCSPTTSDQAVINGFPTVKMGPGDSNRSHTANEYILISEINSGIATYIKLLQALKLTKK
jgi:acetylornithine deacetylase